MTSGRTVGMTSGCTVGKTSGCTFGMASGCTVGMTSGCTVGMTSGCTVGMLLIEHNALPCLSASLPVQLPLLHFTFVSHCFIQARKDFTQHTTFH
jgi:hypothetical protein